MSRDDKIEIELYVHAKSQKAWRVSENGDDAEAEWLPMSQCSVVSGSGDRDEVSTFSVPEWLAERAGLC